MAIKQTYICDGCNLVIEVSPPHERLKVKIGGIPGKADVNAIKDVCSYACSLRIIADLMALPSSTPIEPEIDIDELDFRFESITGSKITTSRRSISSAHSISSRFQG